MVGFRYCFSSLALAFVALAASCGGRSVHEGSDAGNAGEPNHPSAGKSGAGAVSGSGGASGCETPPCVPISCPDGKLVDVPCGCPHCSCEGVACPHSVCSSGEVAIRPEGACCDSCVPTGCEGAACSSNASCPDGMVFERPPGACCGGCVPNGTLGCLEIACNPDLQCPLGYAPGNGTNGCCYDCVPDPFYCEENSDCTFAVSAKGCCACPRVISKRLYAEDVCWYGGGDGRTPPSQCSPDLTCDVPCDCPATGEAWCIDHRCMNAFVPPPR